MAFPSALILARWSSTSLAGQDGQLATFRCKNELPDVNPAYSEQEIIRWSAAILTLPIRQRNPELMRFVEPGAGRY